MGELTFLMAFFCPGDAKRLGDKLDFLAGDPERFKDRFGVLIRLCFLTAIRLLEVLAFGIEEVILPKRLD